MKSATPDGQPKFFYGWLVVGAAFFATFGSVTFFNPVLGVFSQLLEEEFGWSRADVAGALTLAGILAGLGAPFAGMAIDRWGGRWVIVGSAVVMAVCAVLLSQMTTLWHLLALFALGRAVSVGVMSPAGFVATSNWFIRRRPFVAGIVAVGPRIGMATFPLIVALVIQLSGTWRAGWIALAVIVILTTLPTLFFMRRRPEDMGLLPDGDTEVSRAAGGAGAAPVEIDFTLREALRTRAYWLVGIAVGLIVFCGGAINFHQIPHLIDQGLPRTQAALIVTVFSGFGAVGAIVGGTLAQRFTMRWTMVVALVGMSGSILLLLVATSFVSALMYAVAYGSFFGVVVSFMQVVHADYFGRKSMGTIHGSIQPFQMGMNAAGPFLVGLWYDQTGSYSAAFVAFGIIFATAAVGLAFASYPKPPQRDGVGAPAEVAAAGGH